MPKSYVCIWSNDKAEEMAKFYKSVFKAKIGTTTYWGPNPMGVKVGSVLTIEIKVLGQKIMLLNGFVEKEFNDSFSMCVPCKDQREIDAYWKKLSAGGGRPVQCGWIIDKFGVRWQVFPEQAMKWQASKNKKKRHAMNEAMWQMVKLDVKKLKAAFDNA
ncbi:MAG TPA: VOC family protein [Patescibacteria group bacterium]|nr:VOC family protein [Patescibacteria group bacterium]